MFEFLLHAFPVAFALGSFWSNTERKLLLLNLGLCLAIGSLLVFEQAWGGAIVITVAGLSTSYRLIKQKTTVSHCYLRHIDRHDVPRAYRK